MFGQAALELPGVVGVFAANCRAAWRSAAWCELCSAAPNAEPAPARRTSADTPVAMEKRFLLTN